MIFTDDKITEVKKIAKEISKKKKNTTKQNKPKPVHIIDEDRRMIDYFENAYKMVSSRMQSEHFENMGETTKKKCYEIMQKTSNYLNEQLELIGEWFEPSSEVLEYISNLKNEV